MKTYLAAGLGLCEHCQKLLSFEDLPVAAMEAEWRCPKCFKLLTGKSFGYVGEGKDSGKTLWVGPDGKWTKNQPVEPFNLGSWRIIIHPRVF